MNHKMIRYLMIMAILVFGFSLAVHGKPPGKAKDWKIVWQDEFQGEKVDLKKWDYWHPDTKRRKAINKAHNTYLDGKGNLVIRTQKEGATFTAGGLWTHKKFRHKFGYWDGYKKNHKSRSKKFIIKNLMKDFHTFGLLWTEKELVFYVDDKETWRYPISSHVPQYIILSEEIDKWGGPIETENANLPDYFLVDYVRVYMPKDKTELKR